VGRYAAPVSPPTTLLRCRRQHYFLRRLVHGYRLGAHGREGRVPRSVATGVQQATGGNTGPFRLVTIEVPGVSSCGELDPDRFHPQHPATYSPQLQGPITSISYLRMRFCIPHRFRGRQGTGASPGIPDPHPLSSQRWSQSGPQGVTFLRQNDFQSVGNPGSTRTFRAGAFD
jgi:hypothetical protein